MKPLLSILALMITASALAAPKDTLKCVLPPSLQPGDKIALLSPSYHTSMANVQKSQALLREWGFEPVVGPHVGRIDTGYYAGTVEERIADLQWALKDSSIKAILCNRGGYGTIHLVDKLDAKLFAAQPKWLIGYSDITTLLEMENCVGVMGLHGTMCVDIAKDGTDGTTTLMRDILLGKIPRYELPAHPQNQPGHGEGVLVGGNLCTFAPLLGTSADALAKDDIVLFIEEVGENYHNIDRQFYMLEMRGVLARCKGVVLGEFTSCSRDLDYPSVEAMLVRYLAKYHIPVLCGMPSGHDKVNLPLIMGAPVTLDVRPDGATLSFRVPGEVVPVRTDKVLPPSRR